MSERLRWGDATNCVIVALSAMAVLSAGVEPRPGRGYFGACSFVIADSLIGIHR